MSTGSDMTGPTTLSERQGKAAGGYQDVQAASDAWTRLNWDARRLRLDAARAEAARRNAVQFGTDPSWYGR